MRWLPACVRRLGPIEFEHGAGLLLWVLDCMNDAVFVPRVEILDAQETRVGFLRIKSLRLRHGLFQGGMGPELRRDRLEGLGAASVLLYDPALDQVVLLEQFRIGALEAGSGAWLLETVGGHIGPGELAPEVARRESMEEAGAQLLELIPICRFYVSPGLSDEVISLFCGLVDASLLGGVHGLDDEGEDIRVLVMDARAAIGELYHGRANSTSVIIALQWLAMHRQRLMAQIQGKRLDPQDFNGRIAPS
jgi:ADP-ribose pyrophosphatase